MKFEELRVRAKLTRKELEKQLGLKRSSCGKWETGEVFPRVETILKLEKIFGVTADEIIASVQAEKNKGA